MRHKVHTAVRRIAGNVFHNLTNSSARKRVISKFAEKVGIVYFGSVNQHSDDHRMVRGFTVSSSHRDNNYCVGTINSYDVALVDRSDAVLLPNKTTAIYNWVVLAFDLHTKQDIPHLFIGANDSNPKPYESLFGVFPTLQPIELGTFEEYSPEFTKRFSINAAPSNSIQVERLFPSNITTIIGEHFWPLSAEQHEGVLYIYSDKLKITPSLMDVMLENGLWLAGYLDNQAELI